MLLKMVYWYITVPHGHYSLHEDITQIVCSRPYLAPRSVDIQRVSLPAVVATNNLDPQSLNCHPAKQVYRSTTINGNTTITIQNTWHIHINLCLVTGMKWYSYALLSIVIVQWSSQYNVLLYSCSLFFV